jgi:DNA processing protein
LAGGGKTAGVLGCGVDVIYPRENKNLYAETAAQGAVISEFPIGTLPIPMHFPMRNRLISGLCRGVVVVEAAQKSGTQITVDFALEQNRDVFAVPGPIFSSLSCGTHTMIKNQHAKLVSCVDDILDEYRDDLLDFKGPSISQPSLFDEAKPVLKGDERKLVSFLSVPRHFDEIARELKLTAAELAQMLPVCLHRLRASIILLSTNALAIWK